jgi:hypothetical protein
MSSSTLGVAPLHGAVSDPSMTISVRRTDVRDWRYNWLVLGNEKYPCHLSLLGTQIVSTSLGAILLAEQL